MQTVMVKQKTAQKQVTEQKNIITEKYWTNWKQALMKADAINDKKLRKQVDQKRRKIHKEPERNTNRTREQQQMIWQKLRGNTEAI